ncbi:MAG: hybrid sensor histidine kinase/response regulator [Candidatus Pacebacteria bacterium]|nr:hybrid sensor histidine kinase/response regulator [Candidatus Paceibacterota bacterium]
MDSKKLFKFANNWVRDILADSATDANPGPHTSEQEESAESDRSSRRTQSAIEAMMEHTKSLDSQHTLFDCIKDPHGREILEHIKEFTYSACGKEHRFAVKQYEVEFRKELCTAVVIEDHTSVHELAELSEKYRKILLASVVHDIRTPIQGILGAFDSLDTPKRSKEEQQYIEIGRNTCKLLTFLTYDITDMGQLEAGKFRLNIGTFSAMEAAQDCISSLNFAYSRRGLKLELRDESNGNVMAHSDRHRYMQILMNLLGNALKFTREGSVTVTLTADREHDLLITDVKDTGIGIRTEEIPHMFKLFGKLESGASLNPNGVGLGLAICKRLSEALGGKIAVNSTFGQGSVFTFSILANTVNCEFGLSFDAGADPQQNDQCELQRDQRLFAVHSSKSKSDVRYSTVRLGETREETKVKRCECAKILIVDDNPNNVFILKGFAESVQVLSEEVGFIGRYSGRQ